MSDKVQTLEQLDLWEAAYYDRDDDNWSGWKQPKKSSLNVDDFCHSDTVVFHLTDPSTVELGQIYEGKDWDVIHQGNLSHETVAELFNRHERVICLGHGTPYGLMGGNIGPSEAPLFVGKKLFIIWCNADGYFRNHHIGNGYFITGNMPSEDYECRGAGCGEIGKKEMKDNITDWNRILKDHLEDLLEGGDTARAAIEEVRREYIDKWGYHKVTIYNAERTKLQGDPQPNLSSEYWGDDDARCAASETFQLYHAGKRNTADAFPKPSYSWNDYYGGRSYTAPKKSYTPVKAPKAPVELSPEDKAAKEEEREIAKYLYALWLKYPQVDIDLGDGFSLVDINKDTMELIALSPRGNRFTFTYRNVRFDTLKSIVAELKASGKYE